MKAFWNTRVQRTSMHQIVKGHEEDRNLDKRLRWNSTCLENGIVSNIFRLEIPKDIRLWGYEFDVAVNIEEPAWDLPPAERGSTEVSNSTHPSHIWKAYRKFLTKYPSLPPMVRVFNRVYSTSSIPNELLTLPSEYHDVNWKRIQLKSHVTDVPVTKMPMVELQHIMNRVVPWALRHHTSHDGNFGVVRERDGKIVCNQDGFSVDDLRIFRGTQATMIYFNTAGEEIKLLDGNTIGPPPEEKVLVTLVAGETPKRPIKFQCYRYLGTKTVKDKLVTSYLIRDSSGTIQLTLWGVPAGLYEVGNTYTVEKVKIRPVDPRYSVADAPIELQGGTTTVKKLVSTFVKPASDKPLVPDARSDVELGLRLDSLCTVAFEQSVWQEIKDRYGPPPFAPDIQTKIIQDLEGQAVVSSLDLYHAIIRHVRFDLDKIEDIPMSPELHALAADIEPGQPYAVLKDFTIVPLQSVHRCYDKDNKWQTVTVPACSLLPVRRLPLLQRFVSALQPGMEKWGFTLRKEPLVTTTPKLVPNVEQVPFQETANDPRLGGPKVGAFVSIVTAAQQGTPHATNVMGTRDALFSKIEIKEAIKIEAESVEDAINKIQPPLDKKKCGVSLVVSTLDKNAPELIPLWMKGLRSGLIPIFARPISKAKYGVYSSGIRRQVSGRTSGNPLSRVNIASQVPMMANRPVLFVGIDTCHTHSLTTGALVGILVNGPKNGPVMFPSCWKSSLKGSEQQHVGEAYEAVLNQAKKIQPMLSEVVVLQDGSIASESKYLKMKTPQDIGYSFLGLHKRTHIRFTHAGKEHTNCSRGTLVTQLTPVSAKASPSSTKPTFFLQCHDTNLSTARPVHFVVDELSSTWTLQDLQTTMYIMAHAFSIVSSKLPLPVRCAHKLSYRAHQFLSADPTFSLDQIPTSCRFRMWYI